MLTMPSTRSIVAVVLRAAQAFLVSLIALFVRPLTTAMAKAAFVLPAVIRQRARQLLGNVILARESVAETSLLLSTSTDHIASTLTHLTITPISDAQGMRVTRLVFEGGPFHTMPIHAYCHVEAPADAKIDISWRRRDMLGRRVLKGATSWIYQPTADDLRCDLDVVVTVQDSRRMAKPIEHQASVPSEFLKIDPKVASEVERCVKAEDVCWEVSGEDSIEFYTLRVNKNSIQLFRNMTLIGSSAHLQDIMIYIDQGNPFGFILHLGSGAPLNLLALSHYQRDIIILSTRSYIVLDRVSQLLFSVVFQLASCE
eukprot:TRINITY_DN4482_c0_g1_i6.p1 TRINITY_DN4482_c0_g1~~TRINITY_DN4482_c0_g1_i6.p1  ORF type:complete len:313 (-),score=51.69 TRINITY_DN4482_c0_g1_i6:142-1080(-)